MDRLQQKLESVNAANKSNLKKLHTKIQSEINSDKLIFFENHNDSVIPTQNGNHKSKKASNNQHPQP